MKSINYNRRAVVIPMLSIIIPVYCRQDRLNLLIETLSRLIKRDKLELQIEVIVIDDCSEIEITLPAVSYPLILKRNNVNSGAPFSREQGFHLSKGEFVHFHDSDDSIDESWLKELIETIKTNPQLDLLMTARIDEEKLQQKYRLQPVMELLCL